MPHDQLQTEQIEERLNEGIDEQLSKLDKTAILEAAKAFNNSDAESHSLKAGVRKIRKESQLQKRRVAALEDYTCQVCGFRYEYINKNGKKAWIINIDHDVPGLN